VSDADETEALDSPVPVPIKIPKTLGVCADRLHVLKAQKAALNKDLARVQAEITAISNHLIAVLPKSDASGVSGRFANARVVVKQVPRVVDWALFYAHVAKKKAWELLQRRVGETAIKERWDAGERVPGVEPFAIVTVSVTAAKR
jgi:hypothetical protein